MTIVHSSARRGGGPVRVLLSAHSTGRGGAERLAVHEARHLAERGYELWIARPDGPNAAALDAVARGRVRPAPSLPLWGAPAVDWVKAVLKTLHHAVHVARVIRRRDLEAVLVNSSVSLSPVI